jgi:bifunctional DNA-binding transcriptional regulator/antitoxin component of YhaV-PrlF toxin-antitoxin module
VPLSIINIAGTVTSINSIPKIVWNKPNRGNKQELIDSSKLISSSLSLYTGSNSLILKKKALEDDLTQLKSLIAKKKQKLNNNKESTKTTEDNSLMKIDNGSPSTTGVKVSQNLSELKINTSCKVDDKNISGKIINQNHPLTVDSSIDLDNKSPRVSTPAVPISGVSTSQVVKSSMKVVRVFKLTRKGAIDVMTVPGKKKSTQLSPDYISACIKIAFNWKFGGRIVCIVRRSNLPTLISKLESAKVRRLYSLKYTLIYSEWNKKVKNEYGNFSYAYNLIILIEDECNATNTEIAEHLVIEDLRAIMLFSADDFYGMSRKVEVMCSVNKLGAFFCFV